jgi:hypothetical protein
VVGWCGGQEKMGEFYVHPNKRFGICESFPIQGYLVLVPIQ